MLEKAVQLRKKCSKNICRVSQVTCSILVPYLCYQFLCMWKNKQTKQNTPTAQTNWWNSTNGAPCSDRSASMTYSVWLKNSFFRGYQSRPFICNFPLSHLLQWWSCIQLNLLILDFDIRNIWIYGTSFNRQT